MASANIFSQYLQAPKSVLDYQAQYEEADARKANLEARTQQNALQSLALRQQTDQFGQAQTERNALQRIAAGWSAQTPVDERIASLRNSGMPGLMGQADALEKSYTDRRDKESQIGERDAKAGKDKQALADQKKQSAITQVAALNSPQEAMQLLQSYTESGEVPAQLAPALSRMIQTDPKWQLKLVMGISNPEKMLDLLKPHLQTVNAGNAQVQQAVDPMTGQVTETGRTQIMQSPDNAATNATSRANNSATVAQSERASVRADSRSRDANDINRSLVAQKRQLEVDALQEKADQTKKGKEAAAASVVNQVAVIDKALKHPGRATATGLSSTLDPRNFVPGTDATDFRTVLDQIGGAAFLQAFDSLKGGGAITEVEGKKATDAMARLNRAQSDKEFESSLKELRQVMAAGYKRQTGKDLDPPAPAAPKSTRGGPMQKPAKGMDLGDGFTVVN